MSTRNQLSLQTLGSQPIMPKILPKNHWLGVVLRSDTTKTCVKREIDTYSAQNMLTIPGSTTDTIGKEGGWERESAPYDHVTSMSIFASI